MTPAHTASSQLTNGLITHWRKSSHSGDNGNCVEVAALSSDHIGIRDSKNPAGPMLQVSRKEWRSFIARMRANGMA